MSFVTKSLAAVALSAGLLLAQNSAAQDDDQIQYITPSFGGYVTPEIYDVDKRYDDDGEVFEFPSGTLEWNLRIRVGGFVKVADTDVGGNPAHVKAEGGFSFISRKLKRDSFDDISASGLENVYLGVRGGYRLNEDVRLRAGLRYYHDLAGDDNDLNLTDDQNALRPSFGLFMNLSDEAKAFIEWICAYTFEGSYDFSEPTKTVGGSEKFDFGNYQNFRVGGDYEVVSNENLSVRVGLAGVYTRRSERSFDGNNAEGSGGYLAAISPTVTVKTGNLKFGLRGAGDEYGQELGLLSIAGNDFNKPKRDISATFSAKF